MLINGAVINPKIKSGNGSALGMMSTPNTTKGVGLGSGANCMFNDV
jgi:hypothetical protein